MVKFIIHLPPTSPENDPVFQNILFHFFQLSSSDPRWVLSPMLPTDSDSYEYEYGSIRVYHPLYKTMKDIPPPTIKFLSSFIVFDEDDSKDEKGGKVFSSYQSAPPVFLPRAPTVSIPKPSPNATFKPRGIINPYFFPVEVKYPYQLPTLSPSTPRVNIAIISLGGGYLPSDLALAWSQQKISPVPNVIDVSIDGARNRPGVEADIENLLDIQVVGAMTPNSNIYVYFAPNSASGLYNAMYSIVYNTKTIIKTVSISWGAPEVRWSSQYKSAMNSIFQVAASKGITVCVASGDNGSSDGLPGVNADFPCSSPWVLACGGTRLTCPTGVYSAPTTSEITWNNHSGATGGGYSAFFARPSYQTSTQTKRGVPDVSGNADPTTGFAIAYKGKFYAIGGTSAVAPMWAGYLAGLRLNKFVVPYLYAIARSNPKSFNDIMRGNNGAYAASGGWDPCTGLGSPNGSVLSALLQKNAS
jgi:kumamolisin